MATTAKLRSTLRHAAIPALAVGVIAFFGGYAILGENGLLAYGKYQRELTKKQAAYAALDKQREVMKRRVALLDPHHANPDMVDELVRKDLNVVHPDEVVVPLNN